MFRPVPKKKVETPKALTVMQVAAELQISRSTAYSLVRSEGFPKLRVNKRILVPRKFFDEWLEKNTKMTYGDN